MAVVMTTKFYEGDTPAWHDLSKVVFTSPNMDSPNTAGTRSHILPGQLDLGMWYEDQSNMYRMEDKQETDVSTYFGYLAQVHDPFDMDDAPLYITIGQTDQSNWIEYIRERVNSYPMTYTQVAPALTSIISYDDATYSGIAPNIVTMVVQEGGEGGNAAPPILDGAIHFPTPFFPTRVSFLNHYTIHDGEEIRHYSTKTFRISGDGEELFYDNTMTDDDTYTYDSDIFYYSDSTKYSDFYIELLEQNGTFATISGVVMRSLVFTGHYNTSVAAVTCSSGINPENSLNEEGWYVDETGTDPHWVTLSFSEPKRVTKVTFLQLYGYYIKDYKIQACTTINGTYVDLYSGRAPSNTNMNTVTFSNYVGYSYYRLYMYSRYVSSAGYGIKYFTLYEYKEDESVTDPITLYIDNENTIGISHANNAESTDYLFKLSVDSVDGSGVVASGTSIYGWGQTGDSAGHVTNTNSIVFEVTIGECYDCRLTAWDDVTHSTTLNHLIASDRCRVSCLVYNANGTALSPTENEGVSFIHPPVLNKIFKGNTVYEGENLYYGDFDMRYRTGYVLGDYLIFKPMLYNIDDTVPYGIHDHVIVLHYSYT